MGVTLRFLFNHWPFYALHFSWVYSVLRCFYVQNNFSVCKMQ